MSFGWSGMGLGEAGLQPLVIGELDLTRTPRPSKDHKRLLIKYD